MTGSRETGGEGESRSDNSDANPDSLKKILDHVSDIWARARTNAFAHREAAAEYSEKSKDLTRRQLWLALGSLFSIILLGVIVQVDGADESIPGWIVTAAGAILTITSVSFSMGSLLAGAYQAIQRFETLQALHDFKHHSYLNICQRTREVTFIGVSEGRAMAILEDLERDFQSLKIRSPEPEDRHFKKGDELFEQRKKSPARNRISFQRPTAETNLPEAEQEADDN